MGKKWRTALCMAVIALCLPAIAWTARRLPVQTRPLIEEKYAGWSGVLRIWVYEGWTDGDSFAGWLNRCAAMFEKRRSGVYIEARYVDAAALAALETSGVRPPDMILFPPGVLKDADGLAPIDDSAVRPALRGLGGGYAIPVALGGYGWALNRARLDGLPADWSGCAIAAPTSRTGAGRRRCAVCWKSPHQWKKRCPSRRGSTWACPPSRRPRTRGRGSSTASWTRCR